MGLTLSSLPRLFGKRQMDIWLGGISNAGKTAVLQKLSLGGAATGIPPTMVQVTYKNINFTVCDLSAQVTIRRDVFGQIQGLIFVVDAQDKHRIPEAKEELWRLLVKEELRDSILLVLSNKHDLIDAMPAAELAHELGLNNLRNRKWLIQEISAITGSGILEGVDFMSMFVKPEYLHRSLL